MPKFPTEIHMVFVFTERLSTVTANLISLRRDMENLNMASLKLDEAIKELRGILRDDTTQEAVEDDFSEMED